MALAHRHAPALDRLVAMGMAVATQLHDSIVPPQPEAGTPPPPKPDPATLVKLAAAFDRAARGVRRTILLAERLEHPAKPAPDPVQHREAARRRILRTVEDTIHRDVRGPEADALTAELHERLDSLDIEADILTRPIPEIIADILRDLGLDDMPGLRPWKRRTQADIAALQARATTPAQPDGIDALLLECAGLLRNHPS